MVSRSDIKIGDIVFVCDRGKPIARSTVKRVMKRFIELNNGSKWTPGGVGRYPYRPWDFFSLRLYNTKLEEACNRYTVLQRIKCTDFEKLDDKSLYKIIEILDMK